MLRFTSGGHVLSFAENGFYAAGGSHALRVEFVNARETKPVSDNAPSNGSSIDSSNRQRTAPLSKVTYANVWQGVTLTYDAPSGALVRSSYRLAPHGNPSSIHLRYNAPVSVQSDGSLGISFKTGAMTESAPQAWQERDGQRVPVQIGFSQDGENEIAFSVGDYDRSLPLFIDPTITWNTFLGGSGGDGATGVAVDGSGNVYVSGSSNTTWGSPIRSFNGSADAFVAKLDSNGNLIWNTFLGGSGLDGGLGVAVDGSGNVYVTGYSNAAWGAPLRAYTSSNDGFVAKLNSSGQLAWNTFLGSTAGDFSDGIAVDSSGNVYVIGQCNSAWGSPIRSYNSGGTAYDGFVAKLSSSGNLTWNTFVGGSGTDAATSVAVDGNGNVYVTGFSSETWGSPVRASSSGFDGFAAKLDSSGNLSWNTFLGGTGADRTTSVAVDNSGNVYVAGYSTVTWGSPVQAFINNPNQTDAFAARLDSSGDLVWSTFFAGAGDYVGLALDGSGNIYVTSSCNATWGSPLRAFSGGNDAFAAKLSSSGNLIWNTFLGSSGEDFGIGVAVDGGGDVYVAGYSDGTWGSPVHTYGGGQDGFVAKIPPQATPAPSISISDASQAEGNSGTTAFNFTVSLSAPSAQTVSVNYTTLDGSAQAGSDYQAANGIISFAPGETSKQVTVLVNGDTTQEPNETFVVNLYNLINASVGKVTGLGTIVNDDSATPTIQFSSATYNVQESLSALTITVIRSGDTSGAASVNYASSDGTATQHGDYEIALGTINFAAGETSKTFQVLINEDNYVEGSEQFSLTLSNPTGAALGSPGTSTVTITDDQPESLTNPIDDAQSFVWQQYHDFLNREPDPPGLAGWTNTLLNCAPGDTSCDRIHVSAAFFQSAEFQQRGYFLYRFYSVGLGRKPDYSEFAADMSRLSGFLDANQLEAAKVQFITDFMARPAYVAKYNALNNAAFVQMEMQTAGVNLANSATLINSLDQQTATRAQVLRQIVESNEVYQKYYNQAFVVMQYFGYLRRDPDASYLVWIQVLDQNSDPRGMVNGFMNSLEYRQRFGQ